VKWVAPQRQSAVSYEARARRTRNATARRECPLIGSSFTDTILIVPSAATVEATVDRKEPASVESRNR